VSTKTPGNLLIFRIGSIGDTVVSLPCLHAVARAYPRQRRILLTNLVESARALSVEKVLNGSGLIDATLHFPPTRGKLAHAFGLLKTLRALQPEVLVYLAPRPTAWPVYRDLAFFAACGIRRVIGAPLSRGERRCTPDPGSGELEYEAARLARTLSAHFPVDLSAPNWDLRLSSAEHSTAIQHLATLPVGRTLLALSPGSKISAKDWGEENWASLIAALQARLPQLALAFLGAADERPLSERLAGRWSGAKVNLCGALTPRESAAVLGRCHALICHDSGPMHLAACQGTSCVALFGNFNRPRQWYPFGAGHRVLHEARGVRNIDVEQVMTALAQVLEPLPGARGANPSRIQSAAV
jgi:heptosyltransferase III